jgi:glycosyltransferase involved in cell wall biosynthesis
MKILLINHYAGSDQMGMEYRPFYFAREWAARGHSTTIIGSDFSHLRSRQPAVTADLQHTDEEGIRFRWICTNRYVGNGFARVANMTTFAGKLLCYARRIAREERPEVVICSSTYPLDIYGGARIAARADAQLVFEVHDLWPLTPVMLGGHASSHPYIRVLQHAEDRAYRRADRVVSLLPNARDYMVGRGLDPRKFVHIPNGVPVCSGREAVLPQSLAEFIGRERGRNQFLVGYAGGITHSMAVDTLISAAQRLATQGVTFIIAGDGPDAALLRNRVADLDLDNVLMPGRIAKSAIPGLLAEMDVLAVPWRRSPLYRYGVSPNKLFDYMLAGRPIIQASDASNDLVAEAGCGVTVPPEEPALFAAAILRLRADPELRRRMGENGHNFVIENHDCRVLASRFLDRAIDSRSEYVRSRKQTPEGARAGLS